jgi:hypothetical protein
MELINQMGIKRLAKNFKVTVPLRASHNDDVMGIDGIAIGRARCKRKGGGPEKLAARGVHS